MKFTERISLLVTREQLEYLESLKPLSRSEVMRSLIYDQIEAGKAERIVVELDKSDHKMLIDLCYMSGVKDPSRMLSILILASHIMAKSGMWDVSKPLPQLAEELLKRKESQTGKVLSQGTFVKSPSPDLSEEGTSSPRRRGAST